MVPRSIMSPIRSHRADCGRPITRQSRLRGGAGTPADAGPRARSWPARHPAAELRAVFDDDATDYCRHQRIVAFDGDRATAIGHLELNSDPANANLAGVEITPSDDKTAAAVLAELLRHARSDGRTSVIAWGDHTPADHTFWTGLGAELRYTEQESRLDVAAVDPELMARWIEAGPADLDTLDARLSRCGPAGGCVGGSTR